VEATVSADLAISTMIQGTEPGQLTQVDHGGELPALGMQKICMYRQDRGAREVSKRVAEMLRQGYTNAAGRPIPVAVPMAARA
jgi:hypothetical protein